MLVLSINDTTNNAHTYAYPRVIQSPPESLSSYLLTSPGHCTYAAVAHAWPMRPNAFSLLGRARTSWTCSDCASPQFRAQAVRNYARTRQTRPVRISRGNKKVNRIYLAVATVGFGGGAYLLRDDLRHWWEAAARSGRVVSTLYVCIQEYGPLSCQMATGAQLMNA